MAPQRLFVGYSIAKNLRFFEPFFVLFLLAPAGGLEGGAGGGGVGLSFFATGLVCGYQKLLTALLEVPTGFFADRRGRLRSLRLSFACYCLAFPLFALCSWLGGLPQLAALFAAQSLFAVGEAFRTGTHKAVMLDWVDHAPGERQTRISATELIGRTRFWSKLSAGVSAFAGGLLVWRTGSFTWLFVLATLPAAAGLWLMGAYPAWLEGESLRSSEPVPARDEPTTRQPWGRRLAALFATPGTLALCLASVLFESQLKLAQHYLQPLLQVGVEAVDLTLVGGVGAVLVGLYFLGADLLGGVAARYSGRFEVRAGSGRSALRRLHLAAAAIACGAAVGLGAGVWAIGVFGFLFLHALQNLRRPIFVSGLNDFMDKPQRAATLSIESQARSLLFALTCPVSGWIADRQGLPGALYAIAALLLLLVFVPIPAARAAEGQA